MLILASLALHPALAAELAFAEADGSLKLGFGASLHPFDGRARAFSGRLSTDSLTGELVVPVTSLTTGLGPRDSRMHQWCLEATRWPEIRYDLRQVRGGVEGLRAGTGAGTATFVGALTVRDVTRDLEIPVTWSWEGGSLRLEGHVELDWTLWNVPDPAVAISALEPALRVDFDVLARPS